MTSSILDALDPADARRVLAAGRALTLPQGWSPIAESTPADKAYLITEGEVSVRKGGTEVATLGPGAVVGEGAIVNKTLRSATIVALTPLKVVHFTREQVQELVEDVPAFGDALRAAAADRLEGS
ncbi:cyclic nucleotide-binding protein [Nocardioides sp. Root122]|uniref:cyclic nucleotide-binding domain-containing protein n=1 Tax=Nocardioides TaxID=1839 RepID=UPI00070351C9|nr:MULTISPECIES: cyclic nucleotide-binding domain-containing protein [Nocardioides]KQV64294.1 cyclic nucleotide-binding protein [Nocardioides sp. Root122]MCK9824849.1 cyclic nucleotide-binding domain-containing protein [Nocardioides cavernae]